VISSELYRKCSFSLILSSNRQERGHAEKVKELNFGSKLKGIYNV
jgi:hypothetical protein